MSEDRLFRLRLLARSIMSIAPKVGVIPVPRSYRQDGLSVMMTVKDEEDWIEPSLLSVSTIADEIVIVDNGSTDRTHQVAQRLIKDHKLPAKLLSYPYEDFTGATNYALKNTTKQWILRWHGDFVGHTTGLYSLSNLRKRMKKLDQTRYFCVYFVEISLDGDIFHRLYPDNAAPEPFLFTYSPQVHFHQLDIHERLVVPYYYIKLQWLEPWTFHMRWIKPADRLLMRWWWTEWMGLTDKTKWPTLRDYVRHKIKEEWGIGDFEEAARYLVNERCKKFVRYDPSRFGPYPEKLRAYLENPKYRVIYRDGKIIGRNDTLKPGEE